MPPGFPLRVLDASLALSGAVHAASAPVSTGWTPGLRSQLFRATDAIAANIAESGQHQSLQQRTRYLTIALSSAEEVGVHLRLAVDRGCIRHDAFLHCEARRVVVCRMLMALLRALRSRTPQS